jgi:hypothetical protein
VGPWQPQVVGGVASSGMVAAVTAAGDIHSAMVLTVVVTAS